jgi:lipopolysaccharide heptosyltransferase II
MKILLRLPNWLGDVVMSTAFVAAVSQHYPGAEIDIIIKKELAGMADLITGINRHFQFSKAEYKGLAGAYRFGKQFRQQKYDLFFCLPDSLSATVMARATGAKKRVGFSKEGSFLMLTNSYKRPEHTHRVDEYLSLLENFTGKRVDEKSVQMETDPTASKNNLVIINFNSEATSRRMPPDKGVKLINQLVQTFPGQKFAFPGSKNDATYVDQLFRQVVDSSQLINLAGKTDLKGLSVLMAGAKAVLTTDSGPAHLANSVGTPVIVLFGAGNELNTAPFNPQNLTVLRAGQLNCEPCVNNTCKLYGTPKCMELLDEQQIITALSVFLKDA